MQRENKIYDKGGFIITLFQLFYWNLHSKQGYSNKQGRVYTGFNILLKSSYGDEIYVIQLMVRLEEFQYSVEIL